ncbi:MAG: ATP-binding protein [Bacteroidales bacterium]|jgi:predicted ATPase|nr:ATP-binding protein [Bacteroidales bacterium]
MKLAITGAHRVGKTTLIENLLESLPDYEHIPEPYYELEESGHLFYEIPVVEDYLAQLMHSIKQISRNNGNVIFDRCPIDIMAYIEAIGGHGNIQSLYSKVELIMTEIDLLVFVPIESPDVISCPESELPELRNQINELLTDWIWDFGIETIEVTGTPLARKNQVIDRISNA